MNFCNSVNYVCQLRIIKGKKKRKKIMFEFPGIGSGKLLSIGENVCIGSASVISPLPCLFLQSNDFQSN